MKKLVFILIVALLLCMGITTYAEESMPDTVFTSAPITEAIVTDGDMPTDNNQTQNFGVWLWNTITSYALEILATLSLIATAIGVGLNKHQLFPKIANFMKNVAEFITGQKDDLTQWKKKSEAELKEYRKVMEMALAESKEQLKQYAHIVTQVLETEKKLTEEVVQGRQVNAVLLQCLNDQEETLNTIVQSSTLAQWKKDVAGQKHAEHVAAITALQKKETTAEDGETT